MWKKAPVVILLVFLLSGVSQAQFIVKVEAGPNDITAAQTPVWFGGDIDVPGWADLVYQGDNIWKAVYNQPWEAGVTATINAALDPEDPDDVWTQAFGAGTVLWWTL